MKYVTGLFLAFTAYAALIAYAEPPTLIDGEPAPVGEWPASVYASMSGSRCSATVVGPRTLAIAAHCVSDGGSASFTVGANRYTSRCTHSPDYRNNSTADYALCVVDKDVLGIEYETMLMDASQIKVGDIVRLSGYGCTQPGGGGGNDGIFRIGTSKVTRIPSGNSNDVVTQGNSGALCFGDSGGGAFLEVGKDRYLFAVNSRGDIETTSYLSAWFTSQAKKFIESWSKNGQKICGVHADATGCRGGKQREPVDFELKNSGTPLSVHVKPGPIPAEELKKALIDVGF